MVEQLLTATGEQRGQREGKEGIIVHCEKGVRDRGRAEEYESENRRNGETAKKAIGYGVKEKWGNGEGIKAKGGKGEVACVTCTGVTNFVILAQPVPSSTGSGNPVFGSWIPGLALLARNDGLLVFVIAALYLF